ncbi:MAG: glycosyltransferase family 4 protein [Acidobacteria bacterium]|nr:glycosyltransferase family 4 protein [Acidobacteriota bacterium]
MSAPRVLLTTAASQRGGAEQVVLEFLNRLDRARIEPMAAALAGGPLAEELRGAATMLDAGTLTRMRVAGRVLRVVNRLTAEIRRTGVSIVHNHGTMAHLVGGLAAWRAGVPAIHHVQDIYTGMPSVEGALQRCALRMPAESIVAASHAVYLRLIELGALRSRVTTIHNGVSLVPVAPAFTQDDPAVVWSGRLQHWKGAHLFLEAARLVKDAHPSARFWIVGGTLFDMEPEYAGELRARADALGLQGAVTFTGHVPDARPYLASADVVVHCSVRPEPFGLVVAEAMAQGRAVVAFDAGGPGEMIESGVSGRLVAPDDTEALASAVSDLLTRPDFRTRMGEAARRRARRFSVATMVQRMHEVYDAVLASRRA